MSTDFNYRNSEHRTLLPLPTAVELRVLEKVLGHCLHHNWTREEDRSGYRSSVCDTCGMSIPIGSGHRSEFTEPDPELSDTTINEIWLRELQRPAAVEIVANEVFRKVEAAGWNCMVFHNGTEYSCSMSKGLEKFLSGRQTTKSKAIVAAAVQVASGKFPR